jgi:hypothetical protein
LNVPLETGSVASSWRRKIAISPAGARQAQSWPDEVPISIIDFPMRNTAQIQQVQALAVSAPQPNKTESKRKPDGTDIRFAALLANSRSRGCGNRKAAA